MKLWEAITQGRSAERRSLTFSELAHLIGSLGFSGLTGTIHGDREDPPVGFEQFASQLFASNPVVYAAELVRKAVFSQGRFQYRNVETGRLFGNSSLRILEHPWPGGTTAKLLTRMLLHADIGGNSYVFQHRRDMLQLMRPDWVTIILGSRLEDESPSIAEDAELAGYMYAPLGRTDNARFYPVTEGRIAHFAPMPDPLAHFRGMSWLTPVIREIMGDKATTEHKLKFFEQGATPNLIIKFDATQTIEQVKAFRELAEEDEGLAGAYKTLYLGGGVDADVVGANLQQLDFSNTIGKAEPLALDTLIPTPTGWTTMGEVQVGDEVLGRDGRPARVTAVQPILLGSECYRVTFKDGASVVTDAGHRWRVTDRMNAPYREREYVTADMLDVQKGTGYRWAVQNAEALDLKPADLDIDPYVLGVWLGDGDSRSNHLTVGAQDLDAMTSLLRDRGVEVAVPQQLKGNTYRVLIGGKRAGVCGRGHVKRGQWCPACDMRSGGDRGPFVNESLLTALRRLGVLNNKHIPIKYLRGSFGQRLDLFRGLMDTDGTVSAQGQCAFSSKWERFARQVRELAITLGYPATIRFTADDRSSTGGTWLIKFAVDETKVPFFLPRKMARCEGRRPTWGQSARSIISIERVPSVPVRCIAVDTDDHLFLVGESFIPTHNTRILMAAGVHAVIAGASEGMQGSSLNAGNFKQVKRLFSDVHLQDLWNEAAASLEVLVPPPAATELVVDGRRVPFLQDDQTDTAEIQRSQSRAIAALIREGFTAESIKAAITGNDMNLLQHTGLTSVQLQVPLQQPQTDQNGDQESARAALTGGAR